MILSHDLKAFLEVARRGSFAEAARALHITQPAASQRISNLEQRLETQLFLRGHRAVELTVAGKNLLRYAATVESIEQEALGQLTGGGNQGRSTSLHGVLRVGAFSSVSRSVVIPALADFLATNPGVQLDLRTREVWELERLLTTREVDIVLASRALGQKAVRATRLGTERNVLAEPRSGKVAQAYLDHDEFDDTTETFLRLQRPGALPSLRRHFVDDIEGVIKATAAGLGRSVVPRHLLAAIPELHEVPGLVPHEVPVYVCWHEEPEPSRLMRAGIDVLTAKAKDFLASRDDSPSAVSGARRPAPTKR